MNRKITGIDIYFKGWDLEIFKRMGAIFSEAGSLRGASFKKHLQKDHNPQRHQKSIYGRRWLEYKEITFSLSSCKAMVMYYHERFFLKGGADKMKNKVTEFYVNHFLHTTLYIKQCKT